MDSKYHVFRNICSNVFMPELDYVFTKFSFKTVFYRTYYSYSHCACAFEHECVDSIGDNGCIVVDTFDRIATYIEKGECPHFNSVPVERTSETSVSAIHVAAAAGCLQAVKHHIIQFRNAKTGILKLEPYVLAAMKAMYHCVDLYMDVYSGNIPSLCGIRIPCKYILKSEQNQNVIKIKRLSFLELCAQKKELRLLKSILRESASHSYFHKAYELTHMHNLSGMREALMKYDKEALEYRRRVLNTGNVREGSSCAIPAIVCNHPEVLDVVLKYTPVHKLSDFFSFSLHHTCHVLKRHACRGILLKHSVSEGKGSMTTLSNLKLLLQLYSFYEEFRPEIKSNIAEIPNLKHAINTPHISEFTPPFQTVSLMGPLHSYIEENSNLDPDVVRMMLEHGADIDITDFNGNSPLIHLVKEPRWLFCEGFRKTLELMIYENPSLYLNRAAVYLGLKLDQCIMNTVMNFAGMPGCFQVDGQLHSLFGQNDANSQALNFIGPLLIECGFPTTKSSIHLKAENETLDPTEVAYIQKSIDEPRSLKLCCRDSLRRYFRGRSIHKFVKEAVIPVRLKDYILLKDVLLCIDT